MKTTEQENWEKIPPEERATRWIKLMTMKPTDCSTYEEIIADDSTWEALGIDGIRKYYGQLNAIHVLHTDSGLHRERYAKQWMEAGILRMIDEPASCAVYEDILSPGGIKPLSAQNLRDLMVTLNKIHVKHDNLTLHGGGKI
jgi:hypothetical protein